MCQFRVVIDHNIKIRRFTLIVFYLFFRHVKGNVNVTEIKQKHRTHTFDCNLNIKKLFLALNRFELRIQIFFVTIT